MWKKQVRTGTNKQIPIYLIIYEIHYIFYFSVTAETNCVSSANSDNNKFKAALEQSKFKEQ